MQLTMRIANKSFTPVPGSPVPGVRVALEGVNQPVQASCSFVCDMDAEVRFPIGAVVTIEVPEAWSIL